MTTNDERIAARRCYGFTTNDERITIGDVMAEPLWINGKSFTAYGLVRRGRSLTSQTAFGGQLPYKGSLRRPVVNNGRYTQLVYEEWFCDLRIMISANGISRDSHNGPPSLCCPFQQPSCASHWSAPDGLERLWTAPTATSVMSRRPAGSPRASPYICE